MKRIFLIILLLQGLMLKAQDPFYFRIDKSKGLPSNAVYDIFQDSKGFIWFTGGQGLCRYDGKRFVVFNSDKQTLKSGANIQEDKQGRIWYVNFDGYIYYVERDTLKSFQQPAVWGYLRFGIVGNSLFCVEPGAISQYDLKTLRLMRRYHFQTSKIGATTSSGNTFYVLTDKLFLFTESHAPQCLLLPTSIMAHMQAPIMTANDQQLIIASKYAPDYLVMKNKTVTVERFEAPKAFLQNLAVDNADVWFLTTSGLYRRDKQSFHSFFQSINTTTVFRDKDGAYWVGTMRDGLLYIPSLKDAFYPFSEEVNVLANTRDDLIFGTSNDALYRLNLSTFQTKLLWQGTSNHEVYLLHADTLTDQILFTSNSFNLIDFNGRLLVSKTLATKDICRLSDSEYAIAASGFCALYHPMSAGKPTEEFTTLLNNVRGKSITRMPGTDKLLMAANTGLFVWEKGKLQEIRKASGEPWFFNQLVAYQNQILALSSAGQLHSIQRNNLVKPLMVKGLSANENFRRLKVLDQRMYAFAGNSLCRLSVGLQVAERIFSLNNEVDLNDVAQQSGKLVIATSKGFIVLVQNQGNRFRIPALVINGIRSTTKTITHNDFKLSANDRDLAVDFSIISYDPNVRTMLLYRINDGKWQRIDDDRHALELNNLDPGTYRLELKCTNGMQQSSAKIVQFTVAYPFWMQGWFIVLIIIVVLGLIFKFDRWRTARINRKSAEIIERINLEKTANWSKLKAIKSQMNPHFFFNALNTIQSFILENDKRQALSFLNKFSGLTRSMLEMSEKDEVTVAEEIRVLSLYLDIEKVRFNNDFEYEVKVEGFDAELIRMPSLLLQPYVENAVKHGLLHKEGRKKLILSFARVQDELVIQIIDNGVGRKRSAELNAIKQRRHKSFATDATEQRVNLLNQFGGQKISIEYIDEIHASGQSAGTVVILRIPL